MWRVQSTKRRGTARVVLATPCVARWGILGVTTLALLAVPALAKPPGLKLPEFAKVEATVTACFDALPGFRPDGIITRSEVRAALEQLDRIGWSVAGRETLLERVLPDDSFLVEQLRTPDGMKFASRIARYRQGYDRLDRLSQLPHGRRTVRDLIHGAGGYKMIEYMTGSSGGAELGRMLSKVPNGADFNQPTGRIYTLGSLLGELKKAHGAARAPSP